MTYREEVDRFIAEMQGRGVGASTAAPPLFRLLWARGFQIPPPLFLGFVPLALGTGGFFAVAWGVVMWLLVWRVTNLPVGMAIIISLFAGLLFGISMAGYFRWKAARLGISSWDEYGGA